MERIILYPNTPEFELLEKLQPMIKEQMYQAFKAGFIQGESHKYGYTEKLLQVRFEHYCNDGEPLEVKHIILND